MAVANPEAFVMKPQREGGGNNVYGVEVKNVLEKLGRCRERSAYILMDRIVPPSQLNYIIRPNQPHVPELSEVVSELGIYGVLIG
jgi:glutathione synthase